MTYEELAEEQLEEIVLLNKEIELRNSKLNGLTAEHEKLAKLFWQMQAERDSLRARVAELEAALKHMLFVFDRDLHRGTVGHQACKEARAALETAGKESS